MSLLTVKIVLNSIKKFCKDRGDDSCETCPFCVDHGWALDCMFCGPHVGEGVIPENWDLDKVDYKKDVEIN